MCFVQGGCHWLFSLMRIKIVLIFKTILIAAVIKDQTTGKQIMWSQAKESSPGIQLKFCSGKIVLRKAVICVQHADIYSAAGGWLGLVHFHAKGNCP